MPNFVFTKVLKFYNRNSRNLFNKFKGKIKCYLPKHIVLFADSWKPFGHLQVFLSCDIRNPFGHLQ